MALTQIPDPDVLVHDFGLWALCLNRNQDLLGRCYLLLRRPCTDPMALTPAEQADLLELIALARRELPAEVHLQTPPNLWPLPVLPAALEAGIDDLGGIDSHDVINPVYPQPGVEPLRLLLEDHGWQLLPRLCVHQAWLPWLPRRLQQRCQAVARTLAARHGC